MEHTFKKHKLTKNERLWLTEAITMSQLDPRVLKVRLLDKVPVEFDGAKIDYRIWNNQRLTLIGLWLMNSKDPIFSRIDKIVRAIREKILAKAGLDTVSAQDIAAAVAMDDGDVEDVLYHLGQLGKFGGGALPSTRSPHAYASLMLTGANGYDAFLDYTSIWDVMERYYLDRAPSRLSAQPAQYSLNLPIGDEFGLWPGTQPVTKQNTAFIIMPMDPNKPELEDVLEAIKEVCRKFGIHAQRADEVEHSDRITDLVLREIATCEHLIADLSHERPNVYYEVGYAQALKKKPILYRKKGTPIHFDLLVHNVPEYKNATHLRELLTGRFENILGRSAKAE